MIKLNIQRFGSTNKTTHYELSQFVSSDKPSWLNDINSDMSKIDTAINTAKTTADGAATAAGNAATAAETAQTTANTAITNAATADGKATTANTNIGTLAELETSNKTNLVGAINEVNGKVGNLSNLTTTAKTNTVAAINEVKEKIDLIDMTNFYEITQFTVTPSSGTSATVNTNESKIYVKCNTDQSLVKIYGGILLTPNGLGQVKFTTPLRPSKNVTIPCHVIRTINVSDGSVVNVRDVDLELDTNGVCSLDYLFAYSASSDSNYFILSDSLIFLKDLITHTSNV